MPNRIYWVYEFNNASRLGIMARPRGNEWLEDEITDLKKQKVDAVVSLLEQDEISELGLLREESLCVNTEIVFINFPIKDRSIPSSTYGVAQLTSKLYGMLDKGFNIVIHCRMGIGRSSIIAGALMQKCGMKTEEVIPLISHIRGLQVPDTKEQEMWLKSMAGIL